MFDSRTPDPSTRQPDTASVRPGEELPVHALDDYLRARLPLSRTALGIKQFPHGHSNLTYLVSCGSDEWVLRRPPRGGLAKSAHDMRRESRVLTALSACYPLAPRSVLYCEDATVIGTPFHLIERRHGIVLRDTPTSTAQVVPVSTMSALCRSMVENLVKLHAIDYVEAGLGDVGRPEGYVSRQVSGWWQRYQNAQTETIPDLDSVAAWLDSHIPGSPGAAVIHNDYKFDNLLLDPDEPSRIVAVLDWEMATVGDPLTDLGTTLALWFEAGDSEALRAVRPSPTVWPGSLTRAELTNFYAAAGGRAIDNLVFYYVYGLFKLAVIFQQGYARYLRGDTTDSRFAGYREKIATLADHAAASIETGRV
jgi:aminoglycoside phosphotransferase (APT) family kinase protein